MFLYSWTSFILKRSDCLKCRFSHVSIFLDTLYIKEVRLFNMLVVSTGSIFFIKVVVLQTIHSNNKASLFQRRSLTWTWAEIWFLWMVISLHPKLIGHPRRLITQGNRRQNGSGIMLLFVGRRRRRRRRFSEGDTHVYAGWLYMMMQTDNNYRWPILIRGLVIQDRHQ